MLACGFGQTWVEEGVAGGEQGSGRVEVGPVDSGGPALGELKHCDEALPGACLIAQGLLDPELCAFNEVGEVCLEEGEPFPPS